MRIDPTFLSMIFFRLHSTNNYWHVAFVSYWNEYILGFPLMTILLCVRVIWFWAGSPPCSCFPTYTILWLRVFQSTNIKDKDCMKRWLKMKEKLFNTFVLKKLLCVKGQTPPTSFLFLPPLDYYHLEIIEGNWGKALQR